MDLESTSLLALFSANFIVFSAIVIYLYFFYKWDSKTYDDMFESRGQKFNKNGIANDMYIGDGDSNIQSLLDKDQTGYQYAGNTQGMGPHRNSMNPLELTSI